MKTRLGRLFGGLFTTGVLFVTFLLGSGWYAFGTKADGARLERMEASPQWHDGVFENPEPLWNNVFGMFTSWTDASEFGSPTEPIPVVNGDRSRFADAPQTGLRVTWLGHSTALIELDGATFLLDPVWALRPSPFTWFGPARWYPPPIPLEELPPIDAVLISHDHYDHLDHQTIEMMKGWNSKFVVPLGVAAHLEYWGVPVENIVEMDWWESVEVNGVTVNSVPSRHASGRFINDYMATLWAGYALVGPKHRVYYSGDTGLFNAMKDIGEKFGPFDVTMIEIGAYHHDWPDWHIGPEQAVKAHQVVKGKVFLPVHWGMWNLALHGWTEPAERVVAAAKEAGVTLAMPRPGESIEPGSLQPFEKWWPELPWQTAAEHPIVSRNVDL